jgi:hypothetical protein
LQRTAGRGQCHAGVGGARAARIGLQPAPRGAGVHHALPAADQLRRRLQGPAEQQRRRDHDAGRRVLRHHEPGAERQHGRLHRLLHRTRPGGQALAAFGEAGLAGAGLVVQVLPGGHRRAGHAHADHGFGAPQQLLRLALRGAALRLVRFGRLAGQELGQAAECHQQQRAGCRGGAEQRVQECDHGHVQHEPRCVEQRHEALGAEPAQRAQLLQQLGCGVALHGGMRRPLRLGLHLGLHMGLHLRALFEHATQCRRRQPCGELFGGAGQGTRAQHVHRMRKADRHGDQRRQHRQRLDAAAGEHAVEDLQRVERRHQQRHVEQQAESGGQGHERQQRACEEPGHGGLPSVR